MITHIQKPGFAAVAAILLIFISGCKGEILQDNHNADMLTTGQWRMTGCTSYTISGSTDVCASYPACEKDNVYHFNQNGRLEIDEGPSMCSVYDRQSSSVRWGFSDNRQSVIEIDGTRFNITIYDNEFRLSTCFYAGCIDFSVITYGR